MLQKSYILSALILLSSFFYSCKKSSSEVSHAPRKISFNEDWQFFLGDSSKMASSGAQWRTLNVPHDWSIEGEFSPKHPAGVGGGALPGGLGWYKKKFSLAAKDSTRLTAVTFDGVYQDSKVWINGKYLGNRPNGYIGFQYDLTLFLHYGNEPNEILVKVNNAHQPNSRWYSGSGIYRNVWLTKTDKLHVPLWGTFVTTPQVSRDSALIQVEARLVNQYRSVKNGILETSLIYRDQQVNLVASEFEIQAQDTSEVTQQIKVLQPQLWSTEDPQLYSVVTRIKVGGEVVDEYTTKFGIRDFTFDLEKGFILNGEQLKIKGVNNHHDLGPLGAAVNKRAIERQLEIMKEMGVNGIRTAHNPPAPELLELTDEMGFIVMAESFDMWENAKTANDYSNFWDEWHERDVKDMLLRDRNHPSIFIWSIGNEVPEQWSERGAEIGRELARITKEFDPTRPVTAGMNPPVHTNEDDVTLQFDEPQQPNALAGSGALDLIGYNYAHQTWPKHQVNFPQPPFIATETTSALATRGFYEFPSDTTKIWPVRWDIPFDGGNPDHTISAFDQVRTPWGSTHETTWKIIKKHEFLSGFYIWTGFDYLGEPTPYGWPSRSSYFGIVDLAGFPKDTYYMYKSEWTNEPVLHILPHWNWEEGQIVDVWAYYNKADEVELFLNGETMGTKKKQGDDLHVMWRFPFKKGILRAVSKKDGKVVLEKEVRTAGEPAKLTIQPDRSSIKADGQDLSFITVNITDENGIIAPRANNVVHFEVTGGGKIEAVASGDPTSHESFKGTSHSALNGKVLVVIRAGKEAGPVEVTATANGLQKATTTINLE
ncbi:glycoside hydrolase family 2 protein [Salinimicrobium tongyeongense]|uniref:Glycoside hydrolase family 2 protein n=1 Tax=Salinimicrobium tongyeongense TaxID=2809707 RepID=A0ABY6NWA4_9FLAO|nr:beta-galactosidase GalB [Salinimicrobium tongyeongense]UZH56793.1 glycoside hydrolase family 2 protein [Salinimicrobium tongyeongense]